MKKTRLLTAVLAFCLTATANIGHCGSDDLARFVNPMIGTAGGGHTYPGATTPFGFVQVSPDTGNAGWDYCSGYRYEDKEIIGFSHTHLSGTGWMDLGDMLLLPFTGDPLKTQFKSQFSHTKETSKPGYYSVELSDFGVNVELSATRHCAFHRYTFNGSKEGHVLVDLQSAFVPDKKSLDTVVIKSEVKHERILANHGMPPSVYGAQFFLEGLFKAGDADTALELITTNGPRSWHNMIVSGSTLTTEACEPMQ